MKRFIFSLSFSLFALLIYGQITLEECQRKTRENYPLVRQYGLIEKTKEYNLANASKANLPQFTLSGKATWQSEVTVYRYKRISVYFCILFIIYLFYQIN